MAKRYKYQLERSSCDEAEWMVIALDLSGFGLEPLVDAHIWLTNTSANELKVHGRETLWQRKVKDTIANGI